MKNSRLQEPISYDIPRYKPSIQNGLNDEEVASRVESGYVNKIDKGSSKTLLQIILRNTFTFFNIVYMIIFVFLLIAKAGYTQFSFSIVVLANTVIGIIQENKAKKIIDQLSLISAPTVTVVRNGEKIDVSVDSVVLDDIIYLTPGKQICTDAINLSDEIEVNESQLTGESIPIKKSYGDTLYSGSYVVSGNCYAQVERVGKDNYIETLSNKARSYSKPKSEILRSLRYILSFNVVAMPIIAFFLFKKSYAINGDFSRSIIETSGALLGMIPAGLFLLTSVALFVGVIRLGRHKTLVQDIYCIEMLAHVDVLCLDKTGTITDGTMTVMNYVGPKRNSPYTISDVVSSMNTALQEVNPTAKALEAYFGFGQKLEPVKVYPFSSERKFSAVTFKDEGTYILGAPEFVLRGNYDRIAEEINEYVNQGLRVLALVHSQYPLKDGKIQKVPKLVSLIMIQDQIRREAYDTIKYFRENGVKVKVISGDNPVTVSEVAKRVGIEDAEKFISLDGLSDQEVLDAANEYTVFGRVKPHQKKLLIQAMKAKKHTVAMTGDGVNDILALKESDCSIAMASGSEAVRNVAQLVLLDSNFSSMPKVVAEGRRVINNIQGTASIFFVKTLFSVIISISLILNIIPSANNRLYPFSPDQLAMIEFLAIGIPTFFLALQPNKNKISGRFLWNVIRNALPGALTIAIHTMITYRWAGNQAWMDPSHMITIVVLTTCFTCLMVLFIACKPFNAWRSVLFGTIFIACIVWYLLCASDVNYPYFGNIDLVKLDVTEYFYTIILCQTSYTFIYLINVAIDKILQIFDLRKVRQTALK
ncbi:MAG: HAD-IC family P-type ATPase [Bacilli bacterium]